MRSGTGHLFSQVPRAEIPRSQFMRSHNHKTTFDSGYLIPIYWDEVLPGDTFNMSMSCFVRLTTPIVPFMDNLYLDCFFFYVPNRLLWDNWVKLCGEQKNPDDSTDYRVPKMSTGGPWTVGTIGDYFGLPFGTNVPGNALYFRAYNYIWNEWFRDQNLMDRAIERRGDGPDAAGDYPLLRRCKRHDYFTSGLPWPQKGTAVTIPITGSAPVISDGTLPIFTNTINTSTLRMAATNGNVQWTTTPGANGNVQFGSNTGLMVNLNSVTSASINSLRQAWQLQKLLERDARGGTRYIEVVKAHYGVTSSDARMQRPEYLGGGTVNVNIHPISQTSSTDATSPQGNLAAMGTASGSGVGFTKGFEEHGVVIGLCSVRADMSYQNGVNRMMTRDTRYDYYWPALAHIGEQAVLNQEIFWSNDPVVDGAAFCYQERYAEYRYKPSIISGKFRSGITDSMDIWHLAQHFTALPTLGATFMQENPPVDRVLAVEDQPQFFGDFWFNLKCARPLPLYGVPGLVDHF